MKPSDLFFRFLIGIFFSLLLMLFDSLSWANRLRGGIEIILRPETKILSSVSGAANRIISGAKYLSSGPARIADLERRLAAAENLAAASVRNQEKSEASKLLDWAGDRGFSLVPASVLSSGPQLIIEIPPLAKDLTGRPVVSPDGALVGSVAQVGRWSARVKLLSDSQSQIPAAVLKPDKQKLTAGVLVGAFGAALTLEKVLTEIDLQPDLAVVTSGQDDKFPPEILIGWIGKTAAKEESSLYQQAEIVPAVNPSELKTVFIIE